MGRPDASGGGRPRWWPRRLGTQVLLVLSLVTLATMAALYGATTRRVDDVALAASRQWAEGIARAAAAQAGPALAQHDAAALERALLPLARLPGVLRIDTIDAAAQPQLALQVAPHGAVGVLRRPADVQLPQPGEPEPARLRIGSIEAMRVWAPGGAGSVGVTYAVAPAQSLLERLRYDSVAAIAMVSLLTIVAAHLLLHGALAPLRRLAAFSRTMHRARGATLDITPRSQELADLSEALNHASTAMHAQFEAIRATEERTHAVLDAVPDAVIGLNAQAHVDFASPAATSVFGLAPDQFAGLALEQLLPGIDAAEARRRADGGLYMRASGTQLARFETLARRHDGTEFPADVSLARIERPGGMRFTCVIRDITEQRMGLSMLNLYGRALECTTNGIVISDLNMPGQPVFYANAAFERITGYAPHEAIGRNCDFLQRADREQPQIAQLRAAIVQRESCTVVLRNYRKDGSLFFNELAIAPVTEADGSVRHYVGVLNDVTERERTRLAIAERSARLNAVFDLSPDGFVVLDRSGTLVYANRAFVAMTGWEADRGDEALTLQDFDRRFERLCDPAQPPRSVQQVLSEDDNDTVPDTLVLTLPQRRVLARVVRRQHDGETILFFRDITRETEVDRMKSEFLTTAAHELRTPMVSVYGFTELLLHRQVPDARRRDMLETIHRQSSLLINMVNELLDLARIEARQGKDLKCEPCRLGALVDEASAAFAAQGGAQRLQLRLGHADTAVMVDPEKTHRAITNVLSNAFKYSPGGGAVELATVAGEVHGRPAVGLRVRDHGIGMTPEQLARVFERFYRADPSGNIPGTGLGMSLVKEITELQGGRVDIRSTAGEGTEVVLWLPQAEAPALLSAG
ncbi:MAG: PAS domain S-box protein [Piscinibacter sp.]|uniref:PAS domain-containing sensor histidine kinase n=1 Tax=Piscinibacter sp. TaxID=1903157 RepID=UPI002583BE4C|nr:PAS domain S-box protein [Piscinibacter sp.]MCW5667198.1 PAS domain S-box protein [Piscinibacter sp.]